MRSKRFTNTVALLVALRGGLPPGGFREGGKERERGVQEKKAREKMSGERGRLSDPSREQPGPGTPHPLCPLRVLWGGSQLGHGCYSTLSDSPPEGAREPQRTGVVRAPAQVWGGEGVRDVQSVTEMMILRMSSASWGSGFSRSSMTWVVRILPVLLLML